MCIKYIDQGKIHKLGDALLLAEKSGEFSYRGLAIWEQDVREKEVYEQAKKE